MPPAPNASTPAALHDTFRLEEAGEPTLALHLQATSSPAPVGDVLYVHGSTFGADLSVFRRFDGRSWADELNAAGLRAWGLDFAGYGASDRYPAGADDTPAGRLPQWLAQLQRGVAAVRQCNGDRPIALLGHSWGGCVATQYAATRPQDVQALALFGPIVLRHGAAPAPGPASSHRLVSLLAQYRRFIADVPRGEEQVLDEAHFEAWGADWLATDPHAHERRPLAVRVPDGPSAEIERLWAGHWVYEPGGVQAPTLLVRGAWDSLCNDDDAARLLAALGSRDKADVCIPRATHLMHLEQQRSRLHAEVNAFLARTMR
ncbi:alpha/beta hydrolase [Ideonella sp. BN130291]|uniref:alpha/beta hydrolase n=1 Tax=Ideonella sp. BN130291 TaxID=3112940 RepID=UPI002E26B4AB|nr:alpha/beta fold hydrolase [Ideonella sp. BN130291]